MQQSIRLTIKRLIFLIHTTKVLYDPTGYVKGWMKDFSRDLASSLSKADRSGTLLKRWWYAVSNQR
jgi:hypothetical protein